MNIGIIGAGSLGLLFGAYLSKMNHSVTLYTRSIEHSSVLNKEGIVLEYMGGNSSTSVSSRCIEDGICSHDLVIVAVKQYHLRKLMGTIQSVNKLTPFLFIQNGMGHIEMLNELALQNIFVGVVEHGALKKNLNTVVHSGVGVTKISVFKGDQDLLHNIKWNSDSNFFEFTIYDNWYEMLLTKLVVNSMINPLTALFGVENGKLLSNPYFFQLFQQLFHELSYLLKPSDSVIWWNSVVSVCEKTAQNRSSMLRDIEQSRQTEIESILGYLHQLPQYHLDKAPLLNMLYIGIKGLEKQRRR